MPDTTDPEGRWVASEPYRCLRCDAAQTKQSRYTESRNPSALVVWPVERVN